MDGNQVLGKWNVLSFNVGCVNISIGSTTADVETLKNIMDHYINLSKEFIQKNSIPMTFHNSMDEDVT